MLISCPACPKVYKVPASSIPPEGREVRCTSCDAIWFERGLDAELAETVATLPAPRNISLGVDVDEAARLIDAVYRTDGAFESDCDEQGDAARTPLEPVCTELTVTLPAVSATFDTPILTAEPVRLLSAPRHGFAGKTPPRPQQPERPETPRDTFGHRDTVPPGAEAAGRLRRRLQSRLRNQLTPLRGVAWLGWAATAATLLMVVTTQRAAIETVWPRAGHVYARFDPPQPAPRLTVLDVQERYAQSVDGPVLELRGVLANWTGQELPPALLLHIDGVEGAATLPVTISDVPVPSGGERPFVVRVQLPTGARMASLEAPAAADAPAPRGDRFTLQNRGGGWSQTLPEMVVAPAN
jgi:predicted Zn finger-like uncharacterized protein